MMNRKVLVLNQNYEPIGVCNAKRAIIMIFLGKGEMIERYNELIRSVRLSYPLPSVIRIFLYVHVPRKKLILSRKNILKRDNYRCQYCGSKDNGMTVDHVVPRNRGGNDTWENLVAACVKCNTKKGSRTPEEARFKLRTSPRKPSNIMFIQHVIGISDERWKPYLFLN